MSENHKTLDVSCDSKYSKYPQGQKNVEELEVISRQEADKHEDARYSRNDVDNIEEIFEEDGVSGT